MGEKVDWNKKVGEKYGKLTITEFLHLKSNGIPVYSCTCECGYKRLKVGFDRLAKGITTDCGCSKRDRDLLGQRFGRLLVVRKTEKRQKRHIVWECLCDCGNTFYCAGQRLNSNRIVSCGCKSKEKQHFACSLPIHKCWDTMITRCTNKNSDSYNLYGARGITVCDEWIGKNPKGFSNFYDWAMANGYSDEKLPNGRRKYTLDRIDNDKGYSPDNCRFVTEKEQQENKRNRLYICYNGENMLVTKVAEINGINKRVFSSRIASGWDIEKAIKTPIRTFSKKRKHIDGYLTRTEALEKYGITERQLCGFHNREIIEIKKVGNTYFYLESHIKQLSEYNKKFPNKYYQRYKNFTVV